jgi:DNA replication and repair protein RecF
VEHNFYQAWKSARKCLKHRNSLLRHDRIDRAQLAVWTAEFSRLGEQIDSYRQQYIRQLAPVFERVLGQLIELEGLGLSYFRGWDKEHGLAEVLESQLERDLAQRFTHAGPHRADLRLRYQGANAADILSRGQQKLVVCALRVAQGYLLSEIMGRPCVFLVDDLPAELDAPHRKALCQLLEALGCQVFVTCVDRQALTGCWSNDAAIKTFHVEQGKITAVYS